MSHRLPPNPTLKQLKHQAKDLLKGHRDRDAGVCDTLRLLRRFADAGDEEIFAADLALNEAQFALAMHYGFESWNALKKHVLERFGGDAPEGDERPGALLVDNPPPGKGNSNRFARALAMTLAHGGTPADYETIMGDSGLAFILQADENAIADDGDIDIGWWPLAWWGGIMRLEFLGSAVGRRLRHLPGSPDEYRADPSRHYHVYFEKEIKEALSAGILPLVTTDHWWVISGCDDGEPPLLGARSVFDGHERRRLPGYPCNAIIPGEPIGRLDRMEADRAALAYAVALGRDELELERDESIHRCPMQYTRPSEGQSTGRRSYALWAGLLRDPQRWGKHYYHANMVFHLRINRQSAPPYLHAMAARHWEPSASHLLAAAGLYEGVLIIIREADTDEVVMAEVEGREKLAELVGRIADLEAMAVDEMEKALATMRG